MDDLFDVFDEAPPAGASDQTSKKRRAKGDAVADAPTSTSPGNKRRKQNKHDDTKARDHDDSEDSSDSDSDSDHEEDPSHSRNNDPEPRVADTFETQQSREVAASAGLQAQQEDEHVVLQHQVRHQVALPSEYRYVPLSEHKPPADPARTYKFTLDPFQQVSISSIQRNESVLVSAHTSAGKTVVAEYAVAQCLKNNQRVIYTSPIKALSNQKYRDFLGEFGDVGLMTGDVTINPEATCLVMTTEILRSMLYRGSEIMREVAWVVFDEVHYLRDKARGVVWEETIILLPDKVRYVFLSATIPNAMQFAEWITKIHSQPCHVVYTDFRPTPLQHYLFPAGSSGIHLVVDEKGVFRDENFGKAMSAIADKQGNDPADPNARGKGKGKFKKFNKGGPQTDASADVGKIVKMIMTKNYNPVIVFSFSKRECERFALKMSSMSFNSDEEKDMVEQVFTGAVKSLSDEDQQLPQIQNMLPLLKRGVGIHHSGLLPILKEVIEILFQEGLLKVLFATETFSIGLNMPAKTVVFTKVRKFDGVSTRWISSSEFIQMSGRAGRRGLDDRGIVIMMIDEHMEEQVAKDVVRGEQDNLNSAFHLSYNMILNLMRVEGISPEFMLERCFYQFQSIASVSGLEKQLHQVEAERSNLHISEEATIKDYFDLRKNIETYTKDMKEVITHPNYALQYMQPGRMVRIKFDKHDFGWGVVVQQKKRFWPKKQKEPKPQDQYSIDTCLHVAAGSHGRFLNPALPDGIRPPAHGEKTELKVVEALLSCIDQIGSPRLYMPDRLESKQDMEKVRTSLDEVKRRMPDGIALLDPIDNMGIKDESFKKLVRKIEVLENRLRANSLHNSPRLPELYDQYSKKVELNEQAKSLKKQINNALSITQLEELKCRKRVLRRLGFINDNDVVELKARVACEISTGDELVLSELLFNRFFNELTAEQCAAALSCFVFEEKADPMKLGPHLEKPYLEIQKQARIVAKVAIESKLPVNETDYLATFNPGLMEVIFEWAKGAKFVDICKMTSVYEGSMIRVFRRLEELLRQMGEAAKVMGNEELYEKFELALSKLQRDIVAAQSLYL